MRVSRIFFLETLFGARTFIFSHKLRGGFFFRNAPVFFLGINSLPSIHLRQNLFPENHRSRQILRRVFPLPPLSYPPVSGQKFHARQICPCRRGMFLQLP